MVFVIIEWIRGKPINRKIEGIVNGLGKQYAIQDELPEYGNDMNDTLRYQIMMKEAHTR
jgi:hypothetical protein